MTNEEQDVGEKFENIGKTTYDRFIVLLFWATWFGPGEEIRLLFEEHSQKYRFGKYYWCNGDKCMNLVKEYGVKGVPHVTIIDSGNVTHFDLPTVEDMEIKIKQFNEACVEKFEKEKQKAFNKIDNITEKAPLLLFIRGTKDNPEDQQSKDLGEHMKNLNISFTTYNVSVDK